MFKSLSNPNPKNDDNENDNDSDINNDNNNNNVKNIVETQSLTSQVNTPPDNDNDNDKNNFKKLSANKALLRIKVEMDNECFYKSVLVTPTTKIEELISRSTKSLCSETIKEENFYFYQQGHIMPLTSQCSHYFESNNDSISELMQTLII
eukprot:Pgem_evm1s6791